MPSPMASNAQPAAPSHHRAWRDAPASAALGYEINLNGIAIAAKDVNYMRVNRVRRQLGLAWEHETPPGLKNSATLLVVAANFRPPQMLFTPRIRAVVEWGSEREIITMIGHCARQGLLSPQAMASALVLSVSTLSATKFRLAEFFFQNLARRANLPQKFSQTIEFCLAELIANAVLHGHLSPATAATAAAAPQPAQDKIGLTPARQALLENQAIASKHIILSAKWGVNTPHGIEIAVTDQGPGCDPDRLKPNAERLFDPDTPSGRGLALIQGLGVGIKMEQSLREVRLIFD
ncbi:MAG: ATP-binding protein [Candidatus Symbiobacter sp.]|nr:ATP-binding protein [Candidatus Symbiobacter sp.]